MTTDVNTMFLSERLSFIEALKNRDADMQARAEQYNRSIDERIASGRLTPIGGDSYRVDDPGSWDNGEVWTYRRMSGVTTPLLLPQHGLDESLGFAALYTTVPAWHSLGNVIPGGTSDIAEVLELGGINFEVEKRRVRYFYEELKELPDQYVTVRTDTGTGLGVVGSVYTPFQNRDVFEFLTELAGTKEVTWESAGALRGGRTVFVSMRFPEDLVIDAEGINDSIQQYLAFTNSHDGSSPIQGMVTPWRHVCGNTERFALRDAVTRWKCRHTVNAPARVQEAMRSLQLSRKFYEEFRAEENQLARNELLLDEFVALSREIFPIGENPSKIAVTKAAKLEDILVEQYQLEGDRVGRTAYAAERALTGYWDNSAPRRATGDKLVAARATALLEGADDEKKSKVHRKLMMRVA